MLMLLRLLSYFLTGFGQHASDDFLILVINTLVGLINWRGKPQVLY